MNSLLTFICLVFSADTTEIEKLTPAEFDIHLQMTGSVNLRDAPHYISVAVFHKINIYRAEKNIPPLIWEPLLQKSAALHNREMDKHNFFSHKNLINSNLLDPKDRVAIMGLKNVKVGENIALLDTPSEDYIDEDNNISAMHIDQLATEFVTMWQNSKGHNKNMLRNEYNYSGISCYFSNRALQKKALKIYVTNVLIIKVRD
jgi:uncharacterized protein YkwD